MDRLALAFGLSDYLGMRIRPLTTADAAGCAAASTAVGWRADEATWRRMLALGDGFGAATEDGTIAGTVILNRFGDALAMIAMMTVAPEHQRRGVGRRLMNAALDLAAERVVYLYATDEGRALYRTLGFVDDGSEAERLEGRANLVGARACSTGAFLASELVGAGAYDGIRPMRAADLDAVHALDEEAQGSSRRALLAALFEAADRAVVVERDGEIAGYGLAKLADGVRILGPIAVRARDDDARAIACALASGTVEPIRFDLEPGERALREWARELGLVVVGASGRMVRDGRALPGRRTLVRAIAGRAYG